MNRFLIWLVGWLRAEIFHKIMFSIQAQHPDARQGRPSDSADREANESVDPKNKSNKRVPADSSLEGSETELSHYLHYEDNACFFAPSWQDRHAGHDRAHTARS
ncbi:hypothetical protein BDV09DRAFT_161963 [Aspergillus tetrazonus]